MSKTGRSSAIREGQCPQAGICPLSRIQEGTVVCIKQLAASREMSHRLREMGFCEEQQIKLLSREGNLICLVCNARLGISAELAERILVSPLPPLRKVA